MENTNFTNIKETGPNHNLVYFVNFNDKTYTAAIRSAGWQTTDKKKEATVFISKFGKKLSVTYNYRNQSRKIIFSPSNLKTIFLKLNFVKKKNSNTESSRLIKSCKLIVSKKIKRVNKPIVTTKHRLLNSLFTISKQAQDIIHFNQLLLDLDDFKIFKTIHLFIHEKGSELANHHEIKKASAQMSEQKVSEFNNLFNLIKKSKNRSFGQSTLTASNFKIIGTCLAHEMQLNEVNIIFLISRDDFLDQKPNDIISFKELITGIKGLLNFHLTMQSYKTSITNIQKLFISILAPSAASVIEYDFEDPSFISNLLLRLEDIKDHNFNVSDVNHQERINLLGELLNTLRHELSNPLFGLQMSAELLISEAQNAEHREFISEILLAIQRCQKIINNFSQIYSGEPELKKFDLIQLIHEIFTLSKSETKSIRKLITINDLEIIGLDNHFTVFSNQTWLAQILFNLLINSSHALKNNSADQYPEIHIQISDKSEKLRIYFTDNGPGISNCVEKNMFTPFYTTKNDGTGLGLSIIKSLINKLNGSIEYIHNDKGAQFLIELPYEGSNN